ncbi:probable protein phosphatase 2C 26 isoform X1 [Zingiber officinale]|uniref:probable protein phosphatase 2C 26 isoform X1 n=1 Tax=Zingiber officinale TaxID=94328 RepID=UPI001C4B7590|nr:probable protein phosphatase 2C 26 isoform X1 [Zingiber officinale]
MYIGRGAVSHSNKKRQMGRLSILHSLRLLPSLSPLRLSSIRQSRRLSAFARRQIRSELSLSFGSHLIPHPAKVDKGGEDAFLVSNHNGGVFAIADGVSGWADQNVDPALFSRELMANVSELIVDEEVNYNPQVLMRKAHAATSSIGSATVIIAILEKNGILKVANVGDCGLRLIRRDQVVFATSPQDHYFDCPYQLSSEIYGQTYQDATVCSLELIEGDTVVMGSDGLFDNIFDHEIISALSGSQDVSEAANKLANLAHYHSMDSNFDSPYSLEARSRGFDVPWWKKVLGTKLVGGKLDDITVIVGRVIRISLSDNNEQEEIASSTF